MVGTRLRIQSVALVELLCIIALAVYFGLYRKGDVLCTSVLSVLYPSEAPTLPSLTSPHDLPKVQVEKQLHPSIPFEWSQNPNTIIVCGQPESPVVQNQILWFCPTVDQEPRVLVRGSSLVIYGKERHLESILLPELASFLPFPLKVHLVLEESPDLEDAIARSTESIHQEISALAGWPCVEEIQVEMSVVPPYTDKLRPPPPPQVASVSEEDPSLSSTEAAETEPKLPALEATVASDLLQASNLEPTDPTLILYVPSISPETALNFEVEGHSLLQISTSTATLEPDVVHQWLASQMGVNSEHWDSDGSLPLWVQERYWKSASEELAQDIERLFHLGLPFVSGDMHLEPSQSSREHYQYLTQLRESLLETIRQARFQTHFPIEQYAAIFAPLLFPLLVPLLAGWVKELRRYKEKRRGSKEQDS